MTIQAEEQSREVAVESLTRMQNFDVNSLPREAELGKSFSFNDAVEPASRLVDLFNRLPVSALVDFGKTQLDQLERQAAACYNIFDQILNFDATQGEAHATKEALIQKIINAYQGAFNIMFPLVGYSLYKTADFHRLETDARAALQKIKDESEKITEELEKQKSDADAALDEIRKVAAEQGVTQQAIYFKNEADENDIKAEEWRSKTIRIACLLGVFAVLSLFIHKIPGMNPDTTYETIQLAISKILIFSVISYVLFLSAKNFLSHKHNSIVNRHRQNALLTYKTLVEATGENQQASDAVLIHAAACIYSPQPTGYMGSSSDSQNTKSVIELLSKPLSMKSD